MPHDSRSGAPDDQARLAHMLVAARQAVSFVHGRSRADLDTDDMLRRAVINAIQEIGEAAARLSPDGRALIRDVPWDLVVKMRNVLVHVYWGVDLDRVWITVESDLPPLITALDSHMQNPPAAC
ncbi:MAG: DUF86 domain-containing protein [Phycisphaerales bacterium]